MEFLSRHDAAVYGNHDPDMELVRSLGEQIRRLRPTPQASPRQEV